jgi:hypothetical protein
MSYIVGVEAAQLGPDALCSSSTSKNVGFMFLKSKTHARKFVGGGDTLSSDTIETSIVALLEPLQMKRKMNFHNVHFEKFSCWCFAIGAEPLLRGAHSYE